MSLPGYDAWKTTPPESAVCCPHCGRDADDMEEVTIAGLPTYTVVYRCPGCGQLVADAGLADADTYWRERAADERADA